MCYFVAIVFLTFYMEFTSWQNAMLFNDLPSTLCDWPLNLDQCPNDHTTVLTLAFAGRSSQCVTYGPFYIPMSYYQPRWQFSPGFLQDCSNSQQALSQILLQSCAWRTQCFPLSTL
ncbi:uncharacterized protein BDW70DRAFT_135759 [Aspergillus foveolatus]|uniref:uncharacterized protein n=1 Tax=Aspergillus foveolatus TaxID=210207 RepID=UPI003CCD3600